MIAKDKQLAEALLFLTKACSDWKRMVLSSTSLAQFWIDLSMWRRGDVLTRLADYKIPFQRPRKSVIHVGGCTAGPGCVMCFELHSAPFPIRDKDRAKIIARAKAEGWKPKPARKKKAVSK